MRERWFSLALSVVAAGASPLKCGVSTSIFQQNTQVITTAVETGKLAFWWNWATTPNVDTTTLPATVAAAMKKHFVPMLWGQAPVDDYSFLKDTEGHVMGYNEPDLYNPACCNCDGQQTYHPALSSGWLPLFNPKSAANYWKDTVNNMTTHERPGTKLHKIVSPSMANGAKTAAGVTCTLDPAKPGNAKRCEGWLKLFKAAALELPCTRFDGTATNCWDVIDALQIHAYATTAAHVLAKVDDYLGEFADDFAGSAGRTPKELWLTEVAAASSDAKAVTPFVKQLMSAQGGLADRTKYAAVARVSWFSEWFFPAFNVTGHVARPHENWVSSLFLPYGGLSEPGEAFFKGCAEVED